MLRLITYGLKHRKLEGDINFDVRKLKNPHRVYALRDLDGRDQRVRRLLETDDKFEPTVEHIANKLLHEPVDTATVYCYGGRHRSVAVAEAVAQILQEHNVTVNVTHKELHN